MNAFKLETMLKMQKDFQKRVGFDFEAMDENEVAAYIKEMMLWVIDETSEALHELKHAKGWSKKYDSWSNEKTMEQKEKFKNEMVDAFHFFMNILIAVDMDADDLFNRYVDKNKVNIERQNNGY